MNLPPSGAETALLTAIHEAGHAVAAMALVRRSPHPITIVPDSRSLGRAHAGSCTPGELLTVPELEREVQVHLAGLAAEETIGDVPYALDNAIDSGELEVPATDAARALAALQLLNLDEAGTWRRLHALYGRTRRFLTGARAAAAVWTIARRLVEVGTVDGDDEALESAEKTLEPVARYYWRTLEPSRAAHAARLRERAKVLGLRAGRTP